MPDLIALTREVSSAFERCELTHLERRSIDLALAREQHRAYERCLRELGCRLVRLPEEPELPDSVFVEDAAVVLDELAVVARPGAASRRSETASIARALEPYRSLTRIRSPGVLDGGDVLRLGRRLYVGRSSRTNRAAIEQLRSAVSVAGYSVTEVAFSGCLHLKSAVTSLGAGAVLVNPDWVRPEIFEAERVVTVDPAEPAAANALTIRSTVLLPSEYPRTLERLRAVEIDAVTVGVSELLKAEAGVTCCSLVFEAAPERSGATKGKTVFELVTRVDCHLCDRMKEVLDAELPALGLDYRPLDVDADPKLRARFGEVVPVLLRDGKPVAKVRLDRKQLRRIAGRRRSD